MTVYGEIRQSPRNGQYYSAIMGENHEQVWTTELYHNKEDARRALELVNIVDIRDETPPPEQQVGRGVLGDDYVHPETAEGPPF